MWKCFSRSLKAAIENNRLVFSNVFTTQVTQDSRQLKHHVTIHPTFIKTNSCHHGRFRTCCCRSSNEKEKQDDKAKHGTCVELESNWFEALRWSSVLLIGWYVCQPFSRRRISSERHCRECDLRKIVSNVTSSDYSKLVQFFTRNIIKTPLNYVLPHVDAINSKASHSDASSTHEEQIRKKLDNLEKTHGKVKSSLSNWLGTECMQTGQYKEAVGHFNAAAEANNPAAMFNLGICHEMGLGTTQDFKKAAEMYKKASDLGHATAMYNLGVFHVHGWGGVEADSYRARSLFESAAKLGQVDAQKVVNFEDSDNDPPDSFNSNQSSNKSNGTKSARASTSSDEGSSPLSSSPRNKLFYEVEPKPTDPTSLWFKILNIHLDDFMTNNQKNNHGLTDDSGVLDLSPHDEVELMSH